MAPVTPARVIRASSLLRQHQKEAAMESPLGIRRRMRLSEMLADFARFSHAANSKATYFDLHNHLRILLSQVGELDLYTDCLQEALRWFNVRGAVAADEQFWRIPPAWAFIPGAGSLAPRILGHAQECLVRKLSNPLIGNRPANIRIPNKEERDEHKRGQVITVYRAFVGRLQGSINIMINAKKSLDLMYLIFRDVTNPKSNWHPPPNTHTLNWAVRDAVDEEHDQMQRLLSHVLNKLSATITNTFPELKSLVRHQLINNKNAETPMDTWFAIIDIVDAIADELPDVFSAIFDIYLTFAPSSD
jgi:hypothetical protein